MHPEVLVMQGESPVDPARDAETGPMSSLVPTSDLPAAPSRRLRSPAIRALVGVLCGVGIGLLLATPLLLRDRARASAAAAAPVTAQPADISSDAGIVEVAVVDSVPIVEEPPAPVWRVARLAKEPGIEVTDGVVGHRTLLASLVAAGIAKPEVYRVLKAFDGVYTFDHCGVKDTFSVAREKTSGRVVALEYATSPMDVWQARETAVDAGVHRFEGKKLELRVERAKVTVAVAVNDDLRTSIVKAGLDDDVLEMLDDALEGHAELVDLRPGARLRIVATEDRVEGSFARYADLLAVEYTASSPNAVPLRVYHHKTGKTSGYYDAKGRQPYHGGWRSPVPFARISSRYNPRRMHPVMHVVMPHNGVDFAASTGTPVYSAAAGTVRIVGDGGPCGNMVQVLHSNGLVTAYCHLSRFAGGLHPGQRVEARQLVGYVGQTGRVTGPHLHFAVKRGEIFIDPLVLKLDSVKVLPPLEREDFAKARVELDATLDAIPLPAINSAAIPDDPRVDDTVYDEATP